MWFSGIVKIVVVILLYMGKEQHRAYACDEVCRSALLRELKTFFMIDQKLLTADIFKIAIQELKTEIMNEIKTDIPEVSNNNIQSQLELINSNMIKIGNQVEIIEEVLRSQGNTTLQEVEFVKDELVMVNNLSKLYISAVDNQTSEISEDFKLGFATVTDQLETLNLQGNITLEKIELMQDKMAILNATEIHQNIFEISDQINYIETTLNKTSEKDNDVYECTPTSGIPRASLSWHTVGRDRFVRFTEGMTWPLARILCQSNCMDLFKPIDAVQVAKYLDEQFIDGNYWVAGRGDGDRQVWVTTGEAVKQTEPWYGTDYNDVGTERCLGALTHSGHPEARTVLYTLSCTSIYPVLCG